MPALTARAILEVWEQAITLPAYGRTLRLWLSLCSRPEDDADNVTVGQCDRALISVYRSLFGNRVVCRADCPKCHEDHELDLDLNMFNTPQPTVTQPKLRLGTSTLQWRFPRARMLTHLTARPQAGTTARSQLIRECVVEVRQGKKLLPVEAWPSDLPERLAEVMSAADPLLDPRVALECTGCGYAWSVCFDIAAFLWSEIDVVARRLMNEVHRLAAAYGWSESEILDMSAARRAAYLQMCAS